MKKLIFRYSAMNAGKSANLIMTYHNYKELGLNPVAVIPNASKNKSVYSRIGVRAKAIRFRELEDYLSANEVDCILVDEVQFLSVEEINFLNLASINKDITVICYGLRTAANGILFEGSAALLAIADEIEEVPTLCHCGKKARMNLRLIDGKVDKSNEMVVLKSETNIAYVSVCRECYHKFNNGDDGSQLMKFGNTTKCKGGE